jgi:hypothetical protein
MEHECSSTSSAREPEVPVTEEMEFARRSQLLDEIQEPRPMLVSDLYCSWKQLGIHGFSEWFAERHPKLSPLPALLKDFEPYNSKIRPL